MPMVENALKELKFKAKIRLVKRVVRPEQMKDSCLRPICALANPDVLVTTVYGGREIPLIVFEFSEAVLTEDHELQKSYGACSAWLSGIFYVKISGLKQSSNKSGGADYNPYASVRMMRENAGFQGFIYAEWPLQDRDLRQLKTADGFFSCPPRVQLAQDVIVATLYGAMDSSKDWFRKARLSLKSKDSWKAFNEKVKAAPGADDLLAIWRARADKRPPKNTRFFVSEDSLSAKINRFSHAMDPDRGILIFMAMIFSEGPKQRKIYGVYALERTKSMKEEILSIDDLLYRTKKAMDKDRVSLCFQDSVLKKIKNAQIMDADMGVEIDFHQELEHKLKIGAGKVFSTLGFFLDGIRLNHNGPLLTWDRSKLLGGGVEMDYKKLLARYFGFSSDYCPVDLRPPAADEIDEDEVTYLFVHCVLVPNNFRLVAVSYPGAQGGTPILPRPEDGISQPREYMDVIAALPGQGGDVLLNESKGDYKRRDIERDVKKLSRYKGERKGALTNALIKAKILDENGGEYTVLIGVSFAIKREQKISWSPGEVDFMFMVLGRGKWKIGVFSDLLAKRIKSHMGVSKLPELYRAVDVSSGRLFVNGV